MVFRHLLLCRSRAEVSTNFSGSTVSTQTKFWTISLTASYFPVLAATCSWTSIPTTKRGINFLLLRLRRKSLEHCELAMLRCLEHCRFFSFRSAAFLLSFAHLKPQCLLKTGIMPEHPKKQAVQRETFWFFLYVLINAVVALEVAWQGKRELFHRAAMQLLFVNKLLLMHLASATGLHLPCQISCDSYVPQSLDTYIVKPSKNQGQWLLIVWLAVISNSGLEQQRRPAVHWPASCCALRQLWGSQFSMLLWALLETSEFWLGFVSFVDTWNPKEDGNRTHVHVIPHLSPDPILGKAGKGACQPDSPCYFSISDSSHCWNEQLPVVCHISQKIPDRYCIGLKTSVNCRIFLLLRSVFLSGYIPGYLRYIMVEILKNSFKATLSGSTAEEIAERPIHVLICLQLSYYRALA